MAAWLPFVAAQSGTGTVEGRVFNAATGTAVVNARVTLEGTGREVITDESGSYRVAAVPAGSVRVSVAYVGMQGQTATLGLTAGGTLQREFELRLAGAAKAEGETVQRDAFTVVVDREMSAQAVAMNEQRAAPNIKNVVAIDEFGDRGNENIGELLLFLPGVSIATSGSEPTTVALRGFTGNNTGLTVNLGGFVQDLRRCSPTTPDYAKLTRWQELGYYINIGVRGTY